jgi:hypothetical protein
MTVSGHLKPGSAAGDAGRNAPFADLLVNVAELLSSTRFGRSFSVGFRREALVCLLHELLIARRPVCLRYERKEGKL